MIKVGMFIVIGLILEVFLVVNKTIILASEKSIQDKTTSSSSFAQDQSNYYKKFNLPSDTVVFLLLIAVSFFLLGLGLLNLDIADPSDQFNNFNKTHEIDDPTV